MNRSLRLIAAALVAGLSISAGLSGCAASKCEGCDGVQCKVVKPGVTTANKMCVIMNDDPVDPAVTPVVWKGQEYGLCCEGCRPKWNALSDAQKQAAVSKALATSN